MVQSVSLLYFTLWTNTEASHYILHNGQHAFRSLHQTPSLL